MPNCYRVTITVLQLMLTLMRSGGVRYNFLNTVRTFKHFSCHCVLFRLKTMDSLGSPLNVVACSSKYVHLVL